MWNVLTFSCLIIISPKLFLNIFSCNRYEQIKTISEPWFKLEIIICNKILKTHPDRRLRPVPSQSQVSRYIRKSLLCFHSGRSTDCTFLRQSFRNPMFQYIRLCLFDTEKKSANYYLLLPYHSNIPQLVKLAPIDKMKRIRLHSSYFSGLTKFPDFSNIFPVFFDVLFLTEIF